MDRGLIMGGATDKISTSIHSHPAGGPAAAPRSEGDASPAASASTSLEMHTGVHPNARDAVGVARSDWTSGVGRAQTARRRQYQQWFTRAPLGPNIVRLGQRYVALLRHAGIRVEWPSMSSSSDEYIDGVIKLYRLSSSALINYTTTLATDAMMGRATRETVTGKAFQGDAIDRARALVDAVRARGDVILEVKVVRTTDQGRFKEIEIAHLPKAKYDEMLAAAA
jgi:hypothetical protein